MFTHEKLVDHAFDNAETEGAVDTYVYYLHKKLGKDTIETVRGSATAWDPRDHPHSR